MQSLGKKTQAINLYFYKQIKLNSTIFSIHMQYIHTKAIVQYSIKIVENLQSASPPNITSPHIQKKLQSLTAKHCITVQLKVPRFPEANGDTMFLSPAPPLIPPVPIFLYCFGHVDSKNK